MSCILIIEGENFNVNEFLRLTELEPYEKHIRGEKRPFKKTGKTDIYESSGCRFDLSNAEFNQFDIQKEDVIKYLKTNLDKLKLIYSLGIKETETPIIGFAIENRMAEFWCQTEYLQPELLKLVSELNFGIEISQYHPASEDEDDEK
jgi:hypothetical protein